MRIFPSLPGKSQHKELEPYCPQSTADRQQFLSLLLITGGWTVAVLLAFRFVLVPLLTAGNTPVALTLAIAVSIFLVVCAAGALVRELKR